MFVVGNFTIRTHSPELRVCFLCFCLDTPFAKNARSGIKLPEQYPSLLKDNLSLCVEPIAQKGKTPDSFFASQED